MPLSINSSTIWLRYSPVCLRIARLPPVPLPVQCHLDLLRQSSGSAGSTSRLHSRRTTFTSSFRAETTGCHRPEPRSEPLQNSLRDSAGQDRSVHPEWQDKLGTDPATSPLTQVQPVDPPLQVPSALPSDKAEHIVPRLQICSIASIDS